MKFTTIAVASLFIAANATERTLRNGNKKGICKKDVPNVGPLMEQVSLYVVC